MLASLIATRRIRYEIETMTLGKMRDLGVRSLDVSAGWCAPGAGSSVPMPGRTGKEQAPRETLTGCSGEPAKDPA
jgi:hypothetical protein